MHYGGPPGGHHAPPELGHAPPGQHYGPGGGYESGSQVSQIRGEVVKIFSEAEPKLNLGVNGDYAVVVTANDSDPYQQWIKDMSLSTKAKDSAGLPAFSLINKGSNMALAHPKKAEEKVHLTHYHQNSINEEVLWTAADVKHGWHALRSVTNIKHNLDIDHGSKKYGGVHDGQAVIVFEWKDEPNQKWKLEPIRVSSSTSHAVHDHQHHQHRW